MESPRCPVAGNEPRSGASTPTFRRQPSAANLKVKDEQPETRDRALSTGTKRSAGCMTSTVASTTGIGHPPLCTPKKKTKPEAGDDSQDMILESDAGATGSGDEVLECVGCQRSNATDGNFMLQGGEIEFTYSSKVGSWCKDCHTVWRLLYKSRLPLTLMQRYLGTAANRTRFLKELVSLLSLRQENINRATVQAVAARVDTLQFVFDLCNVPFPMWQACALSEVDTANTAGLNFGEMLVGGRRQLVALLPAEPSTGRLLSTGFNLRAPAGQQQRLSPVLHSDEQSDADWWAAHVAHDNKVEGDEEDDGSATLGSSGMAVPPADSQGPGQAPDDDATPAAKKARAALESTRMVLADFTDDQCFTSLKEKTLTKHLGKMLRLQHDLIRAPDAKHLSSTIAECIEAVTAAKTIFQPLLAYQKSYSSAKLSQVFSNIDPLSSFFTKQNLCFGAEMQKILWRARFEDTCQNSYDDAAAMLRDAERMLLGLMKGDKTAVHEFLADCISNAVTNFLGSTGAQEKTLDVVRDDLGARVVAFATAFGELDIHAHGDYHRYLTAAKMIIDAAVPDTVVLPVQLTTAKSTLDNPGATKIKIGWFGSCTGTAIMADADMVLAASALDDDCFAEFGLCEQILSAEGMPRRQGSGGEKSLVGNVAMARKGELMSFIEGSLKHFSASIKSWSPVGMEENMNRILGAIGLLTDCFIFWDMEAHWNFMRVWHPYLNAWESVFYSLDPLAPLPLVPQDLAHGASSAMMLKDQPPRLGGRSTPTAVAIYLARCSVKSLVDSGSVW